MAAMLRASLEVFRVALVLGLTSFGGPIAHIGYFRREYVERRRWLDDATFADLLALSQTLPGPASSQLGIAIGTHRAGIPGGLAAWLGFTAPSAAILIAIGLVATAVDLSGAGWVHGLELAAVAIVAVAAWSMARQLAPDGPRRAIALGATVAALAWPIPPVQPVIIAAGALAGWALVRPLAASVVQAVASPVGRRAGAVALVGFAIILASLPFLATSGDPGLAQAGAFARTGALVFGGGHVVLPLLQAGVVEPGWVTETAFVAGYGLTQAVPGPLFTFAAYLGTVSSAPPGGVAGGLVAVLAIFLPSILLILGVMPFWAALRRWASMRRALAGVGAAVVGLLIAALYDPLATEALRTPWDLLVAGVGIAALTVRRVPPVVVVFGSALAGQLLATVGAG
jgi:chromate transporter